ncbi:MAG: DUF3127 domain-containing protein [Bacteroidetes bacterium]|nr:DUF3127 domain-containing protein [Bacteroidota bacterium]MCH8524059.1 DUF3127 domain-containing protein [Balneolales bacterium]
MEIKGKVITVLPEQNGESKNGTWRKQEFVIETFDQYPKKVCMEIWGDKIDDMMPKEGQEVTASINIESREWNGRWFTNVKAWKIESGSTEDFGNPADNTPRNASGTTPILDDGFDDDDDVLPF